jgi:hypothetical protein
MTKLSPSSAANSASFGLALVLLGASIHATTSFVVPIVAPSVITAPLLFGYRHEMGEGGSGIDYGNEATQQRATPRGLTIPVLNPIPNAVPLMMGAEQLLDPPTLGQWQGLEESVTLHKNYLTGSNLTAIDAAPLVAIMDDYTGAVERPGYVY